MTVVKYVAVGLLLILLALIAVTYVALESGGVLEVETWNEEEQAPRLTHIWFVSDADEVLLEAGNPENGWVKDLTHNEVIVLRGEGLDGEYTFALDESESAHLEIRQRMREKYGWRDAWINLLFDIESSMLVKVQPR